MKLLVDNANIEAIKRVYDLYPMDGVTTNPSFLAKAGRPPLEALHEIRAFIGDAADLHVQVLATDAAGMIEDAHRIVAELGEGTIVKVPSVPQGFKAMRALKAEGYRITGTAIYTPMQAYLAAQSGAEFTAPYINRIDNMGFDGVQICKDIQDIFDANNMPTQMLAASFKNSQQLLELCKYGVGAATVAPEVIEGLVKNAAIDAAIDAFIADFEGLTGVETFAEL